MSKPEGFPGDNEEVRAQEHEVQTGYGDGISDELAFFMDPSNTPYTPYNPEQNTTANKEPVRPEDVEQAREDVRRRQSN